MAYMGLAQINRFAFFAITVTFGGCIPPTTTPDIESTSEAEVKPKPNSPSQSASSEEMVAEDKSQLNAKPIPELLSTKSTEGPSQPIASEASLNRSADESARDSSHQPTAESELNGSTAALASVGEADAPSNWAESLATAERLLGDAAKKKAKGDLEGALRLAIQAVQSLPPKNSNLKVSDPELGNKVESMRVKIQRACELLDEQGAGAANHGLPNPDVQIQ